MRFTLVPLRLLWEAPQNLLGFFAWLILPRLPHCRTRTRPFKGIWHTENTLNFGVSLGLFTFGPHSPRGYALEIRAHEYGHSLQSLALGPLYLIVVGLPSTLFYWLTRLGVLAPGGYYRRFPENWADAWGGVTRPPQK